VQVKHQCGDCFDFVGWSLQGQACGVPEAIGIWTSIGYWYGTPSHISDLGFYYHTNVV